MENYLSCSYPYSFTLKSIPCETCQRRQMKEQAKEELLKEGYKAPKNPTEVLIEQLTNRVTELNNELMAYREYIRNNKMVIPHEQLIAALKAEDVDSEEDKEQNKKEKFYGMV